MSWSSTQTKNVDPSTGASLYSAFESWRYFSVMLLNTFSRNKRRKNCEESRLRSLSALVWFYAMSLTVRCQNLVGSYAWTHSTFNLIGSCNKHPNIQRHKAIKTHTLKPLTYELFFQNSSKTKEIVKTFKDHGPHRRKDKSKCQGCTCKIDEFERKNVYQVWESQDLYSW